MSLISHWVQSSAKICVLIALTQKSAFTDFILEQPSLAPRVEPGYEFGEQFDFLMVFALAGDSTITKFFDIILTHFP